MTGRQPFRLAPRAVVAIAAYNAERYLDETIESVVDQSFRDWHLVVADNASTDGTEAVVRAWADRDPTRISLISVGRNAGAGGGRNAAIAASPPSELIAILDADDRWCDGYLERQIGAYDRAVAAGRRPGVVTCDAYLLTPNGVEETTYRDMLGHLDRVSYSDMIESSHVFVSALFSRRLFDELGGFSEEPWGAEDYDLWLRMLESGHEVVVNDEPLAYYRYHPGAMSTSLVTMSDAILVAYARALARGSISTAQRRAIAARMRHYRALRVRACVREAFAAGDRRRAVAALARAVPLGVVAVAQSPSRWREWTSELLRPGRGDRLAAHRAPSPSRGG